MSERSLLPRIGGAGIAATAMALAAACARQAAPPGGPEDRRPPVVVATVPDTFARVERFRGPVRFQFDERVSERVSVASEDDIVVLSPRTGRVRVDLGRDRVAVELDGGFRPGLVYRVTLLPVVSDMFGNQLRDPFELVFSTGGDLHPNAVAGVAWDRIAGDGVEDATVHVVEAGGDSTVVHTARAGPEGIYALRYLPPGRYTIDAFLDRDRDGELDPNEGKGRATFAVGEADTVLVDVPLLDPDTTPARLTQASVLDSVTLTLRFDDFLDPAVPLDGVEVSLAPGEGAREDLDPPSAERVQHVWAYEAWVDQVADSFARLDSLEAEARAEAALRAAGGETDPAGAEPAQPPAGDSARVPPSGDEAADTLVEAAAEPLPGRPLPTRVPDAFPGGPGAPRGGQPGRSPGPPSVDPATGTVFRGGALPDRRLVVRLAGPLPVNQPVRVSASGVRNVNGVGGGAGEGVVVRQPPPLPDTAAVADSLAAGDTVPPVPDTGRVGGATHGPRRDGDRAGRDHSSSASRAPAAFPWWWRP